MASAVSQSPLSPTALIEAPHVAEILGVRVDHVYKLCREDKIRHARIGRTIRFRREWIDEFIDECASSA